MNNLAEEIGKFLARMIIFFYLVFAEGFVIYKTYHWFIEKQFSLPHMSYIVATGANMFLSIVMMRYGYKYSYKGEEVKKELELDAPLFMPWIALGIAYLLFIILKHL